MDIVRFLERKGVIRFFGVALILAPFINIALHIFILKIEGGISWSQFNLWAAVKGTGWISLFLALFSIAIGGTLLSGSKHAWKFVLLLIGAYLTIQILNIGSRAWKSPLAWPSFILNAGLFFFIFDQLVWKVKIREMAGADAAKAMPTPIPEKFRAVINLKSYRKIKFSFGSDKPWGELKTLSNEMVSVKSIAQIPANLENQVVQLNFSKDVIVDIQYFRQENGYVFFKPLNMDKEKVTNLNTWLKKIAV